MTVRIRDEENADFITLIWVASRAGDSIINPNGVKSNHVTRCVEGSIEFRFADRTIVLIRGQEVMLPLRAAYDTVALVVPAEVHCFYPKADPIAVEEVTPLRASGSGAVRDWPTFDESQVRSRSVDGQLLRL